MGLRANKIRYIKLFSWIDLWEFYSGRSNYFTELCSGFKEGAYLRRIDFCITQLEA